MSVRQPDDPVQPDDRVQPDDLIQPDEAAKGETGLWARLRPWLAVDALWYGLAALVLGIRAQSILTPGGVSDPNADTNAAMRWYGLAIAVLLIGWWGTYRDVSLLAPAQSRVRGLRAWIVDRPDRMRLGFIGVAICANLLAILILRGNWSSWPGGILWAASLALLMVGCADAHISLRLHEWTRVQYIEGALVLATLLVALGMRLWRLGDLAPGMHGDEGEAGTQALAILNGNPVSPFLRGWFSQSNVYYWTLAIFMRVFGTGLFGLRTFAVFCGVVTVLLVYLLGREMFGPRVAIIASAFMAFQSASLIFSRQEFSNVTVPPLEAATLYFLVRGLRTRRYLDWVLAGYAAGLGFYYFAGGRLIAPVAGLFLVYLAVTQRRFLREYWLRVLAFSLAVIAILTPFAAYYVANPLPTNTYPNDRFIWLHHADLTALYGSADWRIILWGQLTRTLSIITHGIDASAMSALDFPIARPLEAVLIVLGLGWALLRWRDSRFFLLSLWFWSSIFVGGVLTTEAPNLPRILGILPVLPLVVAAVLDHLWTQITLAATKVGGTVTWTRYGLVAGGVLVAATIAVSGVQNGQMYLGRYLNEHTNTVVSGQAIYVQRWGTGYYYYDLGAPVVFWAHGDNRFINPHALGEDGANLSNTLPITDNGPKADLPANFMVWPAMSDYLHVLRAYYPGGRVTTMHLGDAEHLTDPLAGYIVSRRLIDAHRTLLARYQPAHGPAISRREPRLGLPAGATPPAGLRYPVQANWIGALVAPAYDTYRFRLTGSGSGRLTIDDLALTGRHGAFLLAQGIHTVRLSASLTNSHTHLSILWADSAHGFQPIPRSFLWDGHIGRGLSGDIQPAPGAISPVTIGAPNRRVDGFLGFRSTGVAFGFMSGIRAHWSGTLRTTQGGDYWFQLNSLGTSSIVIDGQTVVNDLAAGANPNLVEGHVYLDPGQHRVDIRYRWNGGIGYLECWWQPPGKSRQLFVTPQLAPSKPGARRVPDNPPATQLVHPTPESGTQPSGPTAALPAGAAVTLPPSIQPVALAVQSNGQLFVADGRSRRIFVLDQQGHVLRSWGGPGTQPGQFERIDDLAVGPHNQLYVLDGAIPRIQAFTPTGTLTSTIDGRGAWCSPRGFDVSAGGQILVADTCNSAVDVYDSQGNLQLISKGSSQPAEALDQPIDVAAGPNGSIYVADLRQRLVRLDAHGQITGSWPVAVTAAATFTHLALVGAVVYVTAPGAGTVTAVPLSRKTPVAMGGPTGGPGAIAAGPQGRLYLVGSDLHRITVLLAGHSVVR